jgi:hypothetical protein
MDGQDTVHTMWTGDFAPSQGSIMTLTQMDKIKLIQRAKENTIAEVIVTHYADGKTSGTTLDTKDPTPDNTGDSYSDKMDFEANQGNENGSIFHSLKMSLVTNDETVGFEPFFIGMTFYTVGEDKA